MADFTPGPWWIAGAGTIRFGNPHFGRSVSGWIATIHWRNRDANAALIAAAPDQHDALIAAEQHIVTMLTAIANGDAEAGRNFADKDPVVAQIRAAILKARGEGA